mmetsp:Transcript_17896/g.50764  ORF Transcript_17896/g.50764 Transcript_17896/m.50764 type:complete len:166 (-) Transcript_17896:252-749(-)
MNRTTRMVSSTRIRKSTVQQVNMARQQQQRRAANGSDESIGQCSKQQALSLLNVNDIITSSHKQQRLRHLLHTQSDRRNETAHTASSNASCNETPTNIAQAQHQPGKRATPLASAGSIEVRAPAQQHSRAAQQQRANSATSASNSKQQQKRIESHYFNSATSPKK